MKTIALVNPAAGSVTRDGPEKLRRELEQLNHRNPEIHEIDFSDCKGQMERLAAQDPDIMIIWGGDGTLRSALNLIGQKTPNLILLPGGTMNVLPNALHGVKPWNEVLRGVIASPKHHVLPAGKVDDQSFYCALLAGAPARMAEAREKLRKGEIITAAAAARAALDTLQSIHLTAKFGGTTYKFGDEELVFGEEKLPETSVIGALVGPLSKSRGMEIASLSDPSALGALNVVWQSFMTDWRNAPGVRVVSADTLTIESDEPIPAIIDGEKIETGDSLRVEYVEKAAQCLIAG
jgi:diacylglycerol kinase family enzyme